MSYRTVSALQAAHRARLESTMDPRALALLRALERWLPYDEAWERAAQIAGPLLLLEGARPGSIPPEAMDPEAAIRDGLAPDDVTSSGIRPTEPCIEEAAQAWREANAAVRRSRPPER